jgi:hypothetical protein
MSGGPRRGTPPRMAAPGGTATGPRPSGAPGKASQQGVASGRRVSPGVVFLAIAMVGSIAYVAFAVTVRDTSQIPLLASGAVVLAIVFGALAVISLRATWQAGIDGRNGRAIGLGLLGGFAAIAAAFAAAGAIVLFLLASGG